MLGTDSKTTSKYTTGTYEVTAAAIRVRKGAGTQYAQKKFTEMTSEAQSLNKSKKSTGLAYYVKGVKFTAKEIIKISIKEWWALTLSGYVCLMYDGKEYVKTV